MPTFRFKSSSDRTILRLISRVVRVTVLVVFSTTVWVAAQPMKIKKPVISNNAPANKRIQTGIWSELYEVILI
jgi:hypothetical protein